MGLAPALIHLRRYWLKHQHRHVLSHQPLQPEYHRSSRKVEEQYSIHTHYTAGGSSPQLGPLVVLVLELSSYRRHGLAFTGR